MINFSNIFFFVLFTLHTYIACTPINTNSYSLTFTLLHTHTHTNTHPHIHVYTPAHIHRYMYIVRRLISSEMVITRYNMDGSGVKDLITFKYTIGDFDVDFNGS